MKKKKTHPRVIIIDEKKKQRKLCQVDNMKLVDSEKTITLF